jgi:cysteine-rich repeat protein
MKKGMPSGILGTLCLWLAASAHAQVFTYTDEASYLSDLVNFGFGTLQEGFEDNATWGGARFPNAASEVTSQGIIWTANNLTSQISTSGGTARTDLWAVFAFPHGITTGALLTPQRDGFMATSTSAVFGVGGWLVSNTGGAQVRFMLDGSPVDFADPAVTNAHKFFGVIDTAGFSTFEIVETEGNVEDQENIFADDFTFGTLAVVGCGNRIIEAGEQCDDGNLLDGDCCSSSCQFEPPGSPCPDGEFCNGEETCDGTGTCQADTPVDCGDGAGCTIDACDEVGDSCLNTPNDANCDNGLYCDGAETCHATLDCQAGTAPTLDDGIACTDDRCDEGADAVLHTPNDGLCDNGLYCDGAETCHAALDCQAGTAPTLDDGISCTDDRCDEGADAVLHTPND